MKRKLLFGFVATFLFASIGVAQIEVIKTDNSAAATEAKVEGTWLHYDSGENSNAIGLGGEEEVEWVGAIMFPAGELNVLDGFEITKVRAYINHLPNAMGAIFYQGEAEDLTEIYFQTFGAFEGESWNELELNVPVEIDASQDLWIGIWLAEDGDGVFPLGVDADNDADGLGNLAGWGDGEGGMVWYGLHDFGIGGVWNIQALAVGEGEFHPVTFNLDMTGAVAENDIVFDPAIHDVYVTGTFTGWAEPGSNEIFKLEPLVVAKDGLYDWAENWEGYADFTAAGGEAADDMALAPWKVVNNWSGTGNWGASDFEFPGAGTDYGVIIMNPSQTDPAIDAEFPAQTGSKYAAFTQVTEIGDDKWLISPTMEVTANSELSFWARAMTHAYGEERFAVLVSTTDDDPDSFAPISDSDYLESELEWTQYTFPLGAYDGENIYFAINYVSHDAFFFFVDNVMVTDVVAPAAYWYTLTLNVEQGDHQYKYFLVEDEPTWGIGEWAGDPNRSLTVEGPMTVEDIFGEYEEENFIPSISEDGFAVYPNPARDIMNVVSDSQINSLRIFDLSGRLVFSQSYNASQVTMDVSSFNYGLYIMQIATETGIKNVKISITN